MTAQVDEKNLRDLDVRVHREVLGLECYPNGLGIWLDSVSHWFVPSYTTEIAAAWRVVDHLHHNQYLLKLSNDITAGYWRCCIFSAELDEEFVAQDVDVPGAICNAALKMVESERCEQDCHRYESRD